jgi:response regulator RpfG family c-di-GMP phosphodiesterase
MALADVYDALLFKRVYKPAYSHDTARALIEAERGRHFDPAVVDVFVDCHAEMHAIAVKFADDAEQLAVAKDGLRTQAQSS